MNEWIWFLTLASTLTFFAFTQRPSPVRVEELGERERPRFCPIPLSENSSRVEEENKENQQLNPRSRNIVIPMALPSVTSVSLAPGFFRLPRADLGRVPKGNSGQALAGSRPNSDWCDGLICHSTIVETVSQSC